MFAKEIWGIEYFAIFNQSEFSMFGFFTIVFNAMISYN